MNEKYNAKVHSMSPIVKFWNWVGNHERFVKVEYNEIIFWLYIAFDKTVLKSFTKEFFTSSVNDYRIPCVITENCICIDVDELAKKHKFTVQDLWENRPKGIEYLLGEYLD